VSDRGAAGRQWLDDEDVAEVARSIATSFPAAGWLAGTTPVGRFTSHTSAFYELAASSGGQPVALLKVGGDWDAAEAQRIYQDLVEFDRLLEAGGAILRVAPPLGWHGSPPAVCMGRIGGDDLGRLLRASDSQGASTYLPVMRACGEALGLFHGRMDLEGQTADGLALRNEVEKAAASIRVRPWFLDDLDLARATSRRYGDFAPYNIRIDEEGGIWIIDQPSFPARELVHRDVAWFLFNVERRLGWETGNDKTGFDEARSDLVAAFHEGYALTGPVPLDTPADLALLAMYRAHRSLWTARRRFRQRELGEVPAYLRLALRWRAAASRR
jgi:hypothetical protein